MLIRHLPSVVITDFNVVGVTIHEAEANTPLIVDRYGVLALPVASKGVESITGWCLQVIEPSRKVHILEFANRPPSHIRRESPRPSFHEQSGRPFVREGLDHTTKRNVSRDACQSPGPVDAQALPQLKLVTGREAVASRLWL
jgi:hypothetical protein